MGKIYLKRVPEEIKGSCIGCFFFKEEKIERTCKGKYCRVGDHVIFRQAFPGAPKISDKTTREMIKEDREISYFHKTYDGPGASTLTGFPKCPKCGKECFMVPEESYPGITRAVTSCCKVSIDDPEYHPDKSRGLRHKDFQGHHHNVPMGATTGTSGVSGSLTDTVCGTPRMGNENMLICHVCKQMRPKEDFKVIYINAPAQIIIAYACRTCGYIRIKPEDLKD